VEVGYRAETTEKIERRRDNLIAAIAERPGSAFGVYPSLRTGIACRAIEVRDAEATVLTCVVADDDRFQEPRGECPESAEPDSSYSCCHCRRNQIEAATVPGNQRAQIQINSIFSLRYSNGAAEDLPVGLPFKARSLFITIRRPGKASISPP
jgi:hypothetical protein